jgi:hypothetical protein
MILQSKIYLKGEREPIHCSEKAALSVQKLFLDNYTPLSRPITIGRYSFTKDAIRRIEVEKDENEAAKCYWIIYNPQRNTVWKGSHTTYEAAKAELDFQETGMPEGYKHGWMIEKRCQPV